MVALLADRPPRRSGASGAGAGAPLRPRLRLVPDGEGPAPSPSAEQASYGVRIRSIQAPPAGRRHPAAVYRRRRAVAAVSLVTAVGLMIAVYAALAGASGGPLTTTGAAAGLVPATARVWVVQPGDTLWKIATALDPRGDVRPLVDRLAAEIGGSSLYPGEQIPIPSSR